MLMSRASRARSALASPHRGGFLNKVSQKVNEMEIEKGG